jgi:hypothetical protein
MYERDLQILGLSGYTQAVQRDLRKAIERLRNESDLLAGMTRRRTYCGLFATGFLKREVANGQWLWITLWWSAVCWYLTICQQERLLSSHVWG